MDTIGGRYEIRGTLGRGGTAVVYRAFDAVEGREIALKSLDREADDDDPTVRLLFQEEFRRLSQFAHPNFPAAYDIGGLDDRPYFTMELVEGTALNHVSKIDLPVLYAVLGQLLQALSFLHARGYVHRDVKPANMIVSDDGKLKLMDLGLLTPIGATAEEELLGTPAYMAPEVVRGGAITEATDLYAVGVFCYERLAGARPFRGDEQDVLTAHLYEAPAPLGALRPDLPERLVAMVHRLLAKAPADRYASAGEVARDLSELVGHAVLVETQAQKAGYLATDRLVGREGEWSRLRDAVAALKGGGRGGAIFLDASAGVGKSRLLREARLEAKLAGCAVASTSAPEQIGEPLSVFARLAEATLIGRPADDVAPFARGLAPLVPSLRAGPGAAPAEAAPEELARAAADWLAHVAAARPLVLVVDDLHWADLLSVDLLNRALRRLRRGGAPVLFLGAYRGDEVHPGHPVTHTIDEGLADRIAVEPFSKDKLRDLLRATLASEAVPEAFVEGVHRATGGNAFFVNEFLRYLMEEDFVTRRGGHFSLPEHLEEVATPAGLRITIERRLRYLGPEARAAIEAAAVWGDAIQLAAWHRVSGSDDPGAFLDAARALESRLFLQRRGDEFHFLHARARDVIVGGLPPERLGALSLRAAEALEAMPQRRRDEVVPRLAVLYAQGGDRERGTRYSLEAGEAALQKSAETEAFAHFKRAERLLAGSPPAEERDARLLGIYERVARLSSAVWIDAPTCLEWFREAVERNRERGDHEKAFGLSLARAITLTIAGRYEAARGVLAELGRGVEPGTVPWAVLYGVGVCLTDWYVGHQQDCLEHATEAIRIFEANLGAGSPDADYVPYSWALFWREKARSYLGLPIEAANIEKIREMAQRGRSDAIIVWHTMTSVGARACFTGRMDDLLGWKAWAEEASRQVGKIYWFECWISHSYVYGMLGAFRLDALGEHVTRLFRSPDPYQVRLGHLFKGRLMLAYGHYDAAATSLETFLQEEKKDGPDNSYLEGLIYLAFCRLGQGRFDDAAPLVAEGAGLAASRPLGGPLAELQFHRLAAELALQRGEAGAAREALSRALALAEQTDNPVQRGWVEMALARVARAEGGTADDVTRRCARARAAFEEVGNEGALRNLAAAEAWLLGGDALAEAPHVEGDDATISVTSLVAAKSVREKLERMVTAG